MTILLPADTNSVSAGWRNTQRALGTLRPGEDVVFDAGDLAVLPSASAVFVWEMVRVAKAHGANVQFHDPRGVLKKFLTSFPADALEGPSSAAKRKMGTAEQLGRASVAIWHSVVGQISFLGEFLVTIFRVASKSTGIRWRDALLCFERAGIDALPITLLIGFLLGLILAFMSAASLRQFGVEVYVADLIAIGLFRELGPIITAIILAGRSGSAFAAEIGTMKVNEELDALSTFGISPVGFLAVPRVLAAAGVMPILTAFSVMAGLIGGGIVLSGMDVPAVTYWKHIADSSTLDNVLFGLGKSIVFGLLVGFVGCSQGLQTGRTADAVGRAATAAVVGSLVLITLFDGIFAVLSYLVGV